MPLDPRYITGVGLEEYFVDKSTGLPLAGGRVTFYRDIARNVLKPVYQLEGAPPYPGNPYVALPNPIILSDVGTLQDANGNNIPIYYFPYDDDDNIDLYYVTIENNQGTPQFTRQAWPNTTEEDNPTSTQVSISNQLTNPQFATILFNNPVTINITGAETRTISIAPGWDLTYTSTGATTIVVTQTAVAGTTAYPFNPPYTLTVTPGANLTGVSLSQRLFQNPAIWSPQVGALNGFLSGSILLAPGSSLQMNYAPNAGPVQEILDANNLSGNYDTFNNTIQLTPPANPTVPPDGYVDIVLVLPLGAATTFSNVQVVGLESNLQGVVYDQTPVNRQQDFMFHYYNPLLQYKPIPSYLVGWDFALNPTQPLGPTLAASAAGANTSRYTWDQTIVFQSANSGPATSRGANGSYQVTATNATQFALIQYLGHTEAREILNDRIAVNVAAISNQLGGLAANISLWYTDNPAVPDITANNSLVTGLSATGKPNAVVAGWNEVPRSNLGDANFSIATSPNTTNFNDYSFNGWDLNGIAATDTANFFAIVVGTAQLGVGRTCNFHSISLCSGDIATRPAPLTLAQTTLNCQRYFYSTFRPGIVPAQNVGFETGETSITSYANGAMSITSGSYNLPVPMREIPNATFYNPSAANNRAFDRSSGASWATTNLNFNSTTTWGWVGTQDAGGQIGFVNCVHITLDARFGVV